MRTLGLLSLCMLTALPVLAAGPDAPRGAAAREHMDHAHHDHAMAPAAKAPWSAYPLLLPLPVQRGDRSGAPLAIENLQADKVSAFSGDPKVPTGEFTVVDGKTKARTAARVGNYYWLQAQEESAGVVKIASTVRYFSNPGPSPGEMLRKQKAVLEIVPQPLPREHGQYREGERWAFLVRFNNEPLAKAKVAFETENGSKAAYTTDEHGLIAVDFPRDMKPEGADHAGGHGAPKSQFVLAVEHADRGKSYLTAFNYQYAPHSGTGKSTTAGLGFIALGALLATPLLRRPKNKSHKGKRS